MIGPTARGAGLDGAFLVAAHSGFGTMAAWIVGSSLPDQARELSLARYDDSPLMAELTRL